MSGATIPKTIALLMGIKLSFLRDLKVICILIGDNLVGSLLFSY
jgi:hypothetical protein